MERYRGPSMVTVAGLALALLGLGVDLGGAQSNVLSILAFGFGAAVLLSGLVWGAVLKLAPVAKRQLVSAVSADLGADAQEERRELRQLRGAVNEIAAELEYVHSKVQENSGQYWKAFKLPVDQWQNQGRLLAFRDDDAHGAVRLAYREIDRIQHCLDSQVVDDGVYTVADPNRSVTGCDSDRFYEACEAALANLSRVRMKIKGELG